MPMWIRAAIAGSAVLNYMGSQDAADAQSQSANNAANLQWQMYNMTRNDLAPYRAAGGAGLDKLMWDLGIGNRGDYRDAMKAKYTTPGTGGTVQGVQIGGGDGINDMSPAIYQYPDGTTGNTPTKAGTAGAGGFDRAGFRNAMADFRGQGKFGNLSEGFPGAGEPFQREPFEFDKFKFKKEPGYNFRLSEGLKAVENSAAARGTLKSGRTMKELERYGQGFASNEFNNAYGRYFQDTTRDFNKHAWEQGFDSGEYQNAFNRFTTEQNNQYNRTAAVAGIGQTTANTLANANAAAGGQIGNSYMAGGNAMASGYMGGANAINSGVNSGINAYYQNQFMNRMPWGNPPPGSGGTSSYYTPSWQDW